MSAMGHSDRDKLLVRAMEYQRKIDRKEYNNQKDLDKLEEVIRQIKYVLQWGKFDEMGNAIE